MALSPNSAPAAHNQPNSCTVCSGWIHARNKGGVCRTCNARRVGQSNHARAGLPSDEARRRALMRNAWCPVDLRPLYHHLMRSKKLRAKDARAIIEKHMATQAARYWRKAA